MLDQLVESKEQENSKKIGILGVILIVMVSAVAAGILWDLGKLFASYMKEGMGGDLELTALVAPVPVQQEEPKPEPDKPKTEQAVDTRKEIIYDTSQSTLIPEKTEVQNVKVVTVRKGVDFKQGSTDSNAERPTISDDGGGLVQGGGIGGGDTTGTTVTDSDEPQIAKPTPRPVPKIVSGGVVNSKATSLVKPAYPAAARAVRASGAVNVQVTISESGSVISASAVSGHPLLRGAAEAAARSSRFSPTLLSGQPVKVTGVIVYNFVAP
jgi:TonB family protein